MELLALYALTTLGTLFPPVNPEVTAIGFALRRVDAPILLALAAAAGQVTAFGLVYLGGAALVARWKRLHDLVERVRVRFSDHLERRFLAVGVLSALTGIPPVVTLCALADGFRVPISHLMPIVFAGRVLRFFLLTHFAREFGTWLGGPGAAG